MSKKYFIDHISDDALASLTDSMLRIEKNSRNEGRTNMMKLIKIIPAVAMIAIVIGLAVFLPMFINIDSGADVVEPSTNIEYPIGNDVELFVPDIVEKDFFENRILAAITNEKAHDKITAYYSLRDGFYMLDSDITKREKDILLDYLNEYTDLTGNDIIRMFRNNNIVYDPNPVDPYAHVRFGETRDILLLEVEWHTPETYLEFIEKYKNDIAPYMEKSDEAKEYYNNMLITVEEYLNKISEKKFYATRIINGKKREASFSFFVDNPEDIKDYYDSDGYYIFYVYPYCPYVSYFDENGVLQFERFGADENTIYVKSKKEYERVLTDKIIPFCDDLLAKGLITPEAYDEFTTLTDPLDRYVAMYFD